MLEYTNRRTPRCAEPLDHRLDRDLGLLGPARGRQQAVARVDRDDHAVAVLGEHLVEEVDVA